MSTPTHQTPLILLGSARAESDTRKLALALFADRQVELLDLLDYPIAPYSYTEPYPPDDAFQKVISKLLAHEVVVFATPVYWYAMSGLMKIFFDRFTDLMTTQKSLGRELSGKRTFLLAVGSDLLLPEGFPVPFARTSKYFGMEFKGSYYCPLRKLAELPGKEEFLRLISTLS